MTQSDYMINNPTETVFEDVIAAYLAASPLYNLRTSADFDINRMCDPVMLRQFIEEGQPETWAKLSKRFGTEALEQVIREYNRQVDNNGMLKTLRDGFTLQGIKIKLLQFKPDQKRNTPFVALYNKNCFSVVRQMRYSTAAKDKGNELDLAILINGIPFITCELKNESTGQTIVNGMEQYRNHRDPNNRMLKSCLVHFVADNNRVMMTTKLCGENTMFLPFNINTDNPIIEGKYATSYMWEEIFQADSLLNIIQDFIKQYIPRKSKTRERVTIFPRYHQLRCVRRIIADIKEKGNGIAEFFQLCLQILDGATSAPLFQPRRAAGRTGTAGRLVHADIRFIDIAGVFPVSHFIPAAAFAENLQLRAFGQGLQGIAGRGCFFAQNEFARSDRRRIRQGGGTAQQHQRHRAGQKPPQTGIHHGEITPFRTA